MLIANTPQSHETILIDNGSLKSSFDILAKGLKKMKSVFVRVHKNSKNLGYAKANNQGARISRGSILVFINNDVVVTSDWLTPLLRFLDQNPTVAACQPKFHSLGEPKYFDYAGGAGGFIDMFGYPFTRGRIFDSVEEDVGQYDTTSPIIWAAGSCLVMRKKAFWEMGGFDEYFFAYGEETDLCLRLIEGGYSIAVVPASCVFHLGAYTSNKNLPEKIYLIHRNHLYLVFKHYSLWPYFPILIFRVLMDIGALIYYIKRRQIAFIGSVWKAYATFVRQVPQLVQNGVITIRGRNLMKIPYIYRGSIVVDYFLLRRRHFSELYGKTSYTNVKSYQDVTHTYIL